MVVCQKTALCNPRGTLARRAKVQGLTLIVLGTLTLVCVPVSQAQNQAADWQGQIRKYAEAKDWDSAMRLVEEEIARAPQDMDVRAWRAGAGVGRKTSGG